MCSSVDAFGDNSTRKLQIKRDSTTHKVSTFQAKALRCEVSSMDQESKFIFLIYVINFLI
jgi:hypothetical protein